MPHKHNAARRHHIGKMNFKVTNWAEYDAGLRQRGSLTLWIASEAVDGWAAQRRKTRGGQPCYSDLAIETALTLGQVFGLRLRQTEGFLSSVLALMGLDLPFLTTQRSAVGREPGARPPGVQIVSLCRLVRFTYWSTAPAWRSMAPANDWKRSMVPSPVGDGANCTWRRMPTAARSSLTS
jgi:hypothetical protein